MCSHPPQHHTRMYLMNVPPVAAIHTEWKSSCGGPPGGFSGLPICFNDSDSDLSTTGTPIPEKVQMIIESLRSTHSSLDMGNETEGNQVLSGQPGQDVGARSSQGQGFKARRGLPVVMGPKPKFRGPLPATHINNLLAVPEVSSNVDSESQSSDSDDSVDRGIEEAIQEYLKEKDDHKRKAEPEPSTNILQPPKMPRREPPPTVPEPPKPQSDSNKVLTASNQVPKSVKAETQDTTPPAMKKRVKSKTPTCKENPFKKLGTTSKAAVVQKLSSFEQKRGPSISNPLSGKLKCPLVKAVEEHLSDSDSSSDDGIEEAIQRYQQEKKRERHEGGGRQSSKPLLLLKEDSDSSSSDDGIEEAIRHYQLEKQKEKKSVPKLSLSLPPKHEQVSKAAASLYCPESISSPAGAMKKHKLSKKKKKKPETRDVKSYLPSQTPGSSLSLIKTRLAASSPQGNGLLLLTHVEPLREREQEQHTTPGPATLKVNTITTTTAELMCAEAILDISKAVIKIPEAFNPNAVDLININSSSTESSTSLLISTNCHDDDDDDNNKSDDESSVDSEEGIEQEIRKFLEQKAQMHKLLPGSAVGTTSQGGGTNTMTEPEKNTKLSLAQKKTLRLSLTQRRKRKEEGGSRNGAKEERETDLGMKEEAVTKPLTEHDRGSGSSLSSLKKAPLKSVKGSERRREQSGEKSSSLDSDEDLDTAIKDLLKTKKKLKKKTRDMKLKSRKGLKDDEYLSRKTASPLKKLRTESEPKTGSLLKTTLKVTTTTTAQSGNDNREKCKVSKNVSKHPQSNKKKEPLNQAYETDRSEGTKCVECLLGVNDPGVFQIKEDSSSVDSDDSIEQEIRKFLAEKAKVSTTAGNTGDGKEIGNGKGKTTIPLTEKSIKTENQLADIPRMDVTQFPDPPRQSSSEQRGVPDRGVFPNTPPGNPTSILGTARGSCLLSALTPSSYPTALEPADGAARADKRSSGSGSGNAHQYASSEMARGHSHRSFPSPSTHLPRTDSEQWLKSQAFETKEKIHNRNPFQYSSPSFGEKTATTHAYQCGVPASIYQHRRAEPAPALDTPVSTCPDVVRIGRIVKSPLVPFHCPSSSETAVVFSSPFPSLTRRPVETGPSGRYFLQGHGSGPGSRWGQPPTLTPGPSESRVVHVAKNQPTFVELSENKTNHVQVRSREVTVIEGKKERRSDLPAGEKEKEREGRKPEERGGEQIERQGEEECVDETDVSESDERTSPEKKQGFPTLSLSSAIDPGVDLSPYIALNTEERSKRRGLMYKAVAVKQPKTKIKKPVKRVLQFLPLSRKNESTWK
ncbi:protein phosphatase 1 regulatory subunit 26-like [Oncorhynchus keta]|uniref:protein phosphatase 1 regulatory subunit 26-like n=1 Tax=Oncorhynchus keta TaxID=8018 RepID=UPI0015F8BAE6|nr:protein phosphatase 1 regulatory subunit 26-like [Oncorhynchus keta]XP_035628404.1 protein phosphatase 1 regulatory subunit 26-like [Oncorhynchus keta]XP_035628405.1 protein phosphatase 1 regulatory subunit 26-like [Oncorhynchus keta]